MKYVGVDLHKQVISVCVVIQEDNKRKVVARRNLRSKEEDTIESFFAELTPFQVVVEATASYEWFVRLVEPLADRVLLAHPKKCHRSRQNRPSEPRVGFTSTSPSHQAAFL